MSLTMFESILYHTIRAGSSLLLASLGEIFTERSGILNLGIEGLMLMGALSAYMTSYYTNNPYLGILIGALMGGILSLVHAFFSITLGANQVVSGLALAILGTGLSSFIGRSMIGVKAPVITATHIPLLSAIPLLRAIFTHTPIEYMSIMLVVVGWFLLFKTRWGLLIRSVGEDPSAADSMGINVFMVRYICTFFGGTLSGLAGAYLSLVYNQFWVDQMTAGRGWIALGLVIFSLWNPLRALFGAYFFGAIEVISYRLQALGINIPVRILNMTPYILTIIVLVMISFESLKKRIGAPASLGVPYFRE